MGYREFAWLWFAVLIHLTVGEKSSAAFWDEADEGCGVGLHGPPCSGMDRVGPSPARSLHLHHRDSKACSRSRLTCRSEAKGTGLRRQWLVPHAATSFSTGEPLPATALSGCRPLPGSRVS